MNNAESGALEREKVLAEELQVARSKLRGYQTLGQLYETLKRDYDQLQRKYNRMSEGGKQSSSTEDDAATISSATSVMSRHVATSDPGPVYTHRTNFDEAPKAREFDFGEAKDHRANGNGETVDQITAYKAKTAAATHAETSDEVQHELVSKLGFEVLADKNISEYDVIADTPTLSYMSREDEMLERQLLRGEVLPPIASEFQALMKKILALENKITVLLKRCEDLQLENERLKQKKPVKTAADTEVDVLRQTVQQLLMDKSTSTSPLPASPNRSTFNSNAHMSANWEYIDEKHMINEPTGQRVGETRKKEEGVAIKALQVKIQDLEERIKALSETNNSWENYAKEMKVKKRVNDEVTMKEMEEVRREAEGLRRQISENETHKERRNKEQDRMLMAAKARADAEENEKVKMRDELIEEKRTHQRKREELERQIRELERQIRELGGSMEELKKSNKGLEEAVRRAREELRNAQAARMTDPSPMGSISPETELAVLREQVTIWKEDFDKERRDRVRIQDEANRLRTVSQDDRKQVHKSRDEIRKLKDTLTAEQNIKTAVIRELDETKRESTSLKQRLDRYAARARREQHEQQVLRHHDDIPAYYAAHCSPHGHGIRSIPPLVLPTRQTWVCRQCTFENVGVRTTCEMCGCEEGFVNDTAPLYRPTNHCLHCQGEDQCDGALNIKRPPPPV